ncbi:MAG: HIT domain-containing protein [Proteobacteria bacterium]|nr:HIT domain-containing protein [Pseudomonadota bacterium]
MLAAMSEPEPACPLCAPRPEDSPNWLKVAALSASTLYLDRNQTYRGHCQLVFDRRHVEGLEYLAAEEHDAMMGDLRRAARAIVAAVQPDRMNYCSLGNVAPHLHWHLVPRYRSDPRWGSPIYTTDVSQMRVTRLEEPALRALAATLARCL